MKYRWSVAMEQPLLAGQLAHQLQISPLLAQCLINRDLAEPTLINAFLEPRLRNLGDPFQLPDMGKAVDRLLAAREQGQSVIIFGDYDVDGVTSTALLLEALRALGWQVDYYLPRRMEEGYGLSQEAVENCLAKHPVSLMLAVDCGSTTVSSIQWLRDRGVDVIVLDHHQVSDPAPAALALVNPQAGLRSADPLNPRPLGELCSAGLAFKLVHALVKRGRDEKLSEFENFDLRPLLDLVALGTVADIVPLVGENRILVSAGLARLNTTERPGLAALKQVAQSPAVLTTHDVAFQLAPRLNAAGRLETAEGALRLVLAPDSAEALPLAQDLDARNRERQSIERSMAAEAVAAVRSRFRPESDYVIVEGRASWHIGVVGIVASRVLQQFYRPTIIVGGETGEQWRGSGRSIQGFDLAGALRECRDLLVRHGGHAMAAGLTISPGNLDAFRARLNELARRCLTAEQLQPPLRLDSEVGLNEITLDSIAELNRLRPVGQGNPPVQFFARGLSHQRPLQRCGTEKQHVKLWVTDGTAVHEAVWWGAGAESLPVGQFDLAFAPQAHEYNGRRQAQLKVLDWRPAANRPPASGLA